MDEMQEIIDDFIVETRELIEALDHDLVVLEKNPSAGESNDLLNAIFRAIHTVKGASGFLGFDQLVEISHQTEGLLNQLRQGEKELTPAIVDVILEVVDIIKLLVDRVEKKDKGEVFLGDILGKIESAKAGGKPTVEEAGEAAPVSRVEGPSPEAGAEAAESVERGAAVKREMKVEQTVRVDTGRLDDVMNLVGELVLERNRLLRLVKGLGETYEDDENVSALSSNGARLDILTTDLQMAVMRTRMQPVKKVFSRFPRMVRDLARSRGKEVGLVMEGEETELDKSVIEEIGDPLVHLIRNAADHGIETPDEREKAGKEREGLIKLSAYHEGDQIVIEIADDGKGIDPEKIKAKAVKKGIIGESEAERLAGKDVLNLIFAPGFSTAEKVTDVSGRGVGMDVVKTNIARLNGMVNVETELGKGSRFILKLPLTVAIIDALMVGVEGEKFAIPLSSVIETIRISSEDVQTINKKEVISLRDGVLPILRLSDDFNIPVSGDNKRQYVVVIGLAEKRIGVLVDTLIGQEEVVIKPLGEYLSDTEGISGATITGDGEVVLILDINVLIQKQIDASMEGVE